MRAEIERKRRPRLRRVSDPPTMALTARDRGIVLAVYHHRFLRRDQIAALFFPASAGARAEVLVSSCNARLQRLFQHGYLSRVMPAAPDGSTQAVYALDRRGAQLVAEITGVDFASLRWSPKRRRSETYFREHTLAINDLWVSFEVAARVRPEVAIIDWQMDGPELWETVEDQAARRGRLPLRPDAYLELEARGRRAHFFVEVDRGTMTNRRFAEKVRAYRIYWKTGRFRERLDASSFRVLVTAPGPRRRENLRRTAAKLGAQRMFLFAVQAEASGGRAFEPVWLPAVGERPVALER